MKSDLYPTFLMMSAALGIGGFGYALGHANADAEKAIQCECRVLDAGSWTLNDLCQARGELWCRDAGLWTRNTDP